MINQPSISLQALVIIYLNHVTQVAETKNGLKAHQKIHPHYTNEFNELETLPVNTWHLPHLRHATIYILFSYKFIKKYYF
jgi:hypothetical protein